MSLVSYLSELRLGERVGVVVVVLVVVVVVLVVAIQVTGFHHAQDGQHLRGGRGGRGRWAVTGALIPIDILNTLFVSPYARASLEIFHDHSLPHKILRNLTIITCNIYSLLLS